MKYLNNKALLAEIKKYNETGIKTEELGRMLLLLATRYSNKGSFSGYTYKDDMVCEAVFTCLKYLHNFDTDVEKPNPFAYFSKVVHNSFLTYIFKQKKQSKIKDTCYKNIDLLVPDAGDDEYTFFDIKGIDYQPIVGNKKKKKRKKKVVEETKE